MNEYNEYIEQCAMTLMRAMESRAITSDSLRQYLEGVYTMGMGTGHAERLAVEMGWTR